MEHNHQVTHHGDWLGPTPGQHPSDNQGWGEWQHTGWTNNRSSYMPTPSSQLENSEAMEMLRTMQIQQQNFATLQEGRFTTLQEQIQIQGDNFASFSSIQEEQHADLSSQIQTHSDNCNSFSSTILQSIDGSNRVLAGSVNTLNMNTIELTSLYEEERLWRPPSGYRGRHEPFRGRRP